MKNRSGTYGKTRETLPLAASPERPLARREGGGKRVEVKALTVVARRLRKHSTDTEGHLWRYLRDRELAGIQQLRMCFGDHPRCPSHPSP